MTCLMPNVYLSRLQQVGQRKSRIFSLSYWRNLIVFGFGCYVAMSLLAVSPLYRYFLFVPIPAGAEYKIDELNGLAKQDVYVETSSGRLHGWFFQNKGTQVILVSHGTMGNVSSRIKLAKLLLSTGASVMLYDYQGYGLSTGTPSLQALCDDGVAFHDYLTEQKRFAPDQIIAYGESLGCSASCKIVSQRKCAGIILQSGYSSLVSVAREMYPLLTCCPESCFPKPTMDNSAMLKQSHPPLLLIHGKLDRLVPIEHAVVNYAVAQSPKEFVVFEKSGHIDLVEGEAKKFAAVIGRFLSRCAPDVGAH